MYYIVNIFLRQKLQKMFYFDTASLDILDHARYAILFLSKCIYLLGISVKYEQFS